MSEEDTKKATNTMAAAVAVATMLGTVGGGGYQLANYEAQLKSEKAAAEAALTKAKAEKEEAIAACEKAAEESIQEQQDRVNALMERIEALARARSENINLEEMQEKYRGIPNRWATHQQQKGM